MKLMFDIYVIVIGFCFCWSGKIFDRKKKKTVSADKLALATWEVKKKKNCLLSLVFCKYQNIQMFCIVRIIYQDSIYNIFLSNIQVLSLYMWCCNVGFKSAEIRDSWTVPWNSWNPESSRPTFSVPASRNSSMVGFGIPEISKLQLMISNFSWFESCNVWRLLSDPI